MRNPGKRIIQSKIFWFFVVVLLIAGIILGTTFGYIPDDLPNWWVFSIPVWSWLELLMLPAAVFSGFYIAQQGIRMTMNSNFRSRLGFDKKIAEIQMRNKREISKKTIEANLKSSEISRYDEILNTYLNIIMGLINEQGLLSASPEDPIRQSARMHTIIALSRMTNGQNQHVLEAVRAAGLVNKRDPIITLNGANFRRGQFGEVNFTGLAMENVNMVEADLEIANLSYAVMNGGNFRNAMMGGATIEMADLQEAKLWWSDLQLSTIVRTNLYRAHLTQANLTDAKILDCYFVEANLERAVMENANLKGSILRRANLKGANLQKANLRGASFEKADLSGANLSGALMYKANFLGANLTGANLSFANLIGANFEDAIMPDGTLFSAATNPTKFTKGNGNGG